MDDVVTENNKSPEKLLGGKNIGKVIHKSKNLG